MHGATLIYKGHDEPQNASLPFPQLRRRNVDAYYAHICYHAEKSRSKQPKIGSYTDILWYGYPSG
jgi:hypothetical protein